MSDLVAGGEPVHSAVVSVGPVWPRGDLMTTDPGSDTMPLNPESESSTEITDCELDTVSAGVSLSQGMQKWVNELLKFKPDSKAS
jgi:hypothetical protein